MALITVTEATNTKSLPSDRKIIINSLEISRIEPGGPEQIGKSFIYMRDGSHLQVHETQQQIMQMDR